MLSPKAADPNSKQKRRPLQSVINEEDNKFFSSFLSKESSMADPSFRVYYGGVAVSIPFIWETQPGTPKHNLSELFANESTLPPLTPPPSSFRSFDKLPMKLNNRSLFGRLLVKISPRRYAGTRSMLVSVKTMDYFHRRRFSSRGSSSDSVFFADEERDVRWCHSGRFLCFGFGERTCRW